MFHWKRWLLVVVALCGSLAVANGNGTAEAQWGYRVHVHYPAYYYPAYVPTYPAYYSSYYYPAYYRAYYPAYGTFYRGCWW